MPLMIVIPVRNEEARLGAGLTKLAASLKEHGLADTRVVVADNGSTDRTAVVCAECAGLFPSLPRYLWVSDQPDKGLAILTAWRQAPVDCDILAYCDVDMATDPEAFARGCRLIREGRADAVAGSRWHAESKVVGRTWRRALLSKILSLGWRLLPGARVTDPGCGLKLVRRSSFDALRLPPGLGSFAAGAEVLVRLSRAGAKVAEIPVDWNDDDAKRIRLGRASRDYLRAGWRLLWSR